MPPALPDIYLHGLVTLPEGGRRNKGNVRERKSRNWILGGTVEQPITLQTRKRLNRRRAKKPYKTPSLRFESVFEVSALSCGKVSSTAKRLQIQHQGFVVTPLKMRADIQGNASIELACGLAEEVVRTFGEVRLRVFGTSMVPSILPGDLVLIQRASLHEISAGEVVLFLRDGTIVRPSGCGPKSGGDRGTVPRNRA